MNEKDEKVEIKNHSVSFWAEGDEYRIIAIDMNSNERIINTVTSRLEETLELVRSVLECKEKKAGKLSKVQEIFVNREGLAQEYE